jgi:hypothetical protein
MARFGSSAVEMLTEARSKKEKKTSKIAHVDLFLSAVRKRSTFEGDDANR